MLEDILGRPSRWNGEASLESCLFCAGAARYNGSIGVSETVFTDFDLRWRTLIHEALHTFSPRYTHMAYLSNNKYIAVLEDLRLHLKEDSYRFYSTLLATPLADRAALLKQSTLLLTDQERHEFGAALLRAVWTLSR